MSSKHQALVSCRWLADKLVSAPGNLRVLDGSWYMPRTKRHARQEYLEKHIPGALFFDIDDCSDQSSHFDHMLPEEQQFGQCVRKLGINNDTHVVIYDNSEKNAFCSAPRVWWTFRVFGHSLVSVLNGGLLGWQAEGFPVTDKTETTADGNFKASFRSPLVKSLEDLETNIAENGKYFTVVETRRPGKYNGVTAESYPGVKPGHIRGSLNLPYHSLKDTETGLMKSSDELKKVFDGAGVDLNKALVASCGSGISACMLALAAHTCDKEDVAVYDGSWVEWFKRAKPENMLNVPKDDL